MADQPSGTPDFVTKLLALAQDGPSSLAGGLSLLNRQEGKLTDAVTKLAVLMNAGAQQQQTRLAYTRLAPTTVNPVMALAQTRLTPIPGNPATAQGSATLGVNAATYAAAGKTTLTATAPPQGPQWIPPPTNQTTRLLMGPPVPQHVVTPPPAPPPLTGRLKIMEDFHQQRQASTRSLYEQTAQSQVRSAYYATPQGRGTVRAEAGAQQSFQDAQEREARQRTIAQYGQVGGALLNMKGAMGALNPVFAAVSVATAAFGKTLQLVSKASPNSAATYAGSKDILEAKLGSHGVPVVEGASAILQRLANALPEPGEKSKGEPGAFSKFFKWLNEAHVSGYKKTLDTDKPLMRSMAGLPQASIGSAEQYQTALQLQGLRTQPSSTEAELLRIQISNLEKLGVLLSSIDGKTTEGGMSRGSPAFR